MLTTKQKYILKKDVKVNRQKTIDCLGYTSKSVNQIIFKLKLLFLRTITNSLN